MCGWLVSDCSWSFGLHPIRGILVFFLFLFCCQKINGIAKLPIAQLIKLLFRCYFVAVNMGVSIGPLLFSPKWHTGKSPLKHWYSWQGGPVLRALFPDRGGGWVWQTVMREGKGLSQQPLNSKCEITSSLPAGMRLSAYLCGIHWGKEASLPARHDTLIFQCVHFLQWAIRLAWSGMV